MSSSMWITLEREIPGVKPLDIDGKGVARALDRLNTLAGTLGVTPLGSFLSFSREELSGAMTDFGLELDEGRLPAEKWFAPGEGLRTLGALLQELRKLPDEQDLLARVAADLQAWHNVLAAAAREQLHFHLSMDY